MFICLSLMAPLEKGVQCVSQLHRAPPPSPRCVVRYLAGASPADRAKLIHAALGIANKLLLATEPFTDFSHALKRSQGVCVCARVWVYVCMCVWWMCVHMFVCMCVWVL
jgi:hypothetical protein